MVEMCFAGFIPVTCLILGVAMILKFLAKPKKEKKITEATLPTYSNVTIGHCLFLV